MVLPLDGSEDEADALMVVTQVVRIDAGQYRGGGEIQAEQTGRALQALGVEVRPYSPLAEDLGDLVHFFGCFGYYDEIARHLRRQSKPYVVSPIFATHRDAARLRRRASRQHMLGGYEKESQALLRGAAAIFSLSAREEENVRAYFGEDLPAFTRVPNGVEDRFLQGDPSLFARHAGLNGPYALLAATIQPDKGQLTFIRACGSEVQGVILGREEDADYARECRVAAGPNILFVEPVPHDSDLLASAYAGAHAFCLPSRHELCPLSAMEAMAAGCRMLLADAWGSAEMFGREVRCFPPDDSARLGVMLREETALQRPTPRTDYQRDHSWEAAARKILAQYEASLRGSQ